MNPKVRWLLIPFVASICLMLAWYFVARLQRNQAHIDNPVNISTEVEANRNSLKTGQLNAGVLRAELLSTEQMSAEEPNGKETDEQLVCIYVSPSKSLYPPVEIYIIDPLNRRYGFDAVSKQGYREILAGSYGEIGLDDDETGEQGPTWKELMVQGVPSGSYIIKIVGKNDGTYTTEIYTSPAKEGGKFTFEDKEISKGEVQEIRFELLIGEGLKNVRYIE